MGYQDDVQEAVIDLHMYLSDQKPPLMVSDSISMLMKFPAEIMAQEISSWLGGQVLDGAVADYLYHAAKKISLLGDLELVARDELQEYRPRLAVALVEKAPEDQRDVLKQNLDRLNGPAHSTGMIRRPLAAPPPPTAAAAPAIPSSSDPSLSLELRHLALMLERLRPMASAPPEQKGVAASHFVAAAAAQSKDAAELQQRLRPLNEIGIDTTTAQIFRTLADNLAGWVLPRGEGQAPAQPAGEQVQAMRQIVTLANDPAEAAKRFREMVHAAIEQFNRGELGRAVTMFEMAELLITDNKIKPAYVDALRKDGHQYLDQARLKKFGDRADLRNQLRVILQFFTALQPVGLLNLLDGEGDREKRHQLLALLEVHGAAARAAAWDMLNASLAEGETPKPFLQMNLVYLLRIITRPKTLTVDEEVSVVVRVSGRNSPPPLVKQVIAYLAYVRHEKAEKALFSYLKVFETMLLNPASAVYTPADLDTLLDRTCAALARYGTPRAWTLMMDHGLKTDPRLGAPYLRLIEAGRFDLSASKDLVVKALAAIQAELPKGGLLGGLGAKPNEAKAVALIQALAGTPLPEVTECFTMIKDKHKGKLAETATKALTNLSTLGKPPAQAAFSGSLEIFGLPNVLQTIAQSQLSGVLSVLTEAGKPQASLVFAKGMFLAGEHEKIVGDAAVYQLLERPFPGTFSLVNKTDPRGANANPQDIFGLLMEGVRRHDEYKRAAALVSDLARLKATGKPNTPPEGEDPAFAASVWKEVTAGKTPLEIEAVINTDCYRIRQALSHWVDQGALAPQ
jgi:hypothetical protein